MARVRNSVYPRNLKTPEEIAQFLERRDTPVSEFFYKAIRMRLGRKNEVCIILYYPPLLDKVDPSMTDFLYDATFKTAPFGFYQAFNIAADLNGQLCLLFCVLMTRKAYPLYREVLRTIREDFPELNPQTATADFEWSILKGIHETYPRCEVTSCQFHFGHALNKKMKSPEIGIFRWIKNYPACNLIYRKYLSIPFLPARDIPIQLRELRKQINTTLPPGARPGFRRFHLYVKTYWIRRVRPERISVFGMKRRTNNGLENLHGQFSRYLVKHANIFKFVEGVRVNVWYPSVIRIQQEEDGVLRAKMPKKRQREREEKIIHWRSMYLGNRISLDRYHLKMAEMYHSYDHKLRLPEEGHLLFTDVEDEFHFEDPVRQPPPAENNQRREPNASSSDSEAEAEADPQPGTSSQNRLRPQSQRRQDLILADEEPFEPLEGWPDLNLSDDELLVNADREDTVAEQALQTERHMNQLIPICPICLDEMKDPHFSACGHSACLACYISCNVDCRNQRPYPTCHACRAPIKRLFKMFQPRMLPRHEVVDQVADQVAQADADLNVLPADVLEQHMSESSSSDELADQFSGQAPPQRRVTVLSRSRPAARASQGDLSSRNLGEGTSASAGNVPTRPRPGSSQGDLSRNLGEGTSSSAGNVPTRPRPGSSQGDLSRNRESVSTARFYGELTSVNLISSYKLLIFQTLSKLFHLQLNGNI